MNLEQQVTSRKISKKLKELGVKQESLFLWCDGETDVGHKTFITISTDLKRSIDVNRNAKGFAWSEIDVEYSAFTVAELGEILPTPLVYLRFNDKAIKCIWIEKGGREHEIISDTESDARGKMLIYLLENKLITL